MVFRGAVSVATVVTVDCWEQARQKERKGRGTQARTRHTVDERGKGREGQPPHDARGVWIQHWEGDGGCALLGAVDDLDGQCGEAVTVQRVRQHSKGLQRLVCMRVRELPCLVQAVG